MHLPHKLVTMGMCESRRLDGGDHHHTTTMATNKTTKCHIAWDQWPATERISISTRTGRRAYNEDRHSIAQCGDTTVFTLLDGHGGYETAELGRTEVPQRFFDAMQRDGRAPSIPQALRQAVEATEDEVERSGTVSGSTLLVAVRRGTSWHLANLGDSRAIVCGRDADGKPTVLFETKDHTLKDENERKRVQMSSGHPDVIRNERIGGILVVPRALGDLDLKRAYPRAISIVPDYLPFEGGKRTDDDTVLVMATDGLWDVMSNEMVSQLVAFYLDNDMNDFGGLANYLGQSAFARASMDNITVMCVGL